MTSWRTGKWAEPLEFRYPSWKENVSKCPLLPAKADTKELKFCNPFLNKILAVFECYGHAISCKGKTLHFAPASLWPFPILFFFRFLHEITTIIKLYWTLFFSWWTQFIFRIFAIFYCLCIFGFLKIRLQRKDTRKEVRTFELEKMIVWLLWNFCPLCISTFLSNFGSKALIKGRQMQVLHCSERLHKIREKQILLLQFGSILLRVITLNFYAKTFRKYESLGFFYFFNSM